MPSASNTAVPAKDGDKHSTAELVQEAAQSAIPGSSHEQVEGDIGEAAARRAPAPNSGELSDAEVKEPRASEARQVTLSKLLQPRSVEPEQQPGATSSETVGETVPNASEEAPNPSSSSPPPESAPQAAVGPSNHTLTDETVAEQAPESSHDATGTEDAVSEAEDAGTGTGTGTGTSTGTGLPVTDATGSEDATSETGEGAGDADSPSQGLAGLIGRILGTGNGAEGGEAQEGAKGEDDVEAGGAPTADAIEGEGGRSTPAPNTETEVSVEVLADGSAAIVGERDTLSQVGADAGAAADAAKEADATVVVDDIEIVQDDVAGLGDQADDAGMAVHAKVNFAKAGAGAVVIRANEESQNKASLLSESRDSYFMSPCAANKFIDVQLSDDVTVTEISLSNFERFASVIEDFRLLGSQSYPSNHWIVLGNFTAEDRHGEQTFHVSPTSKMTMVRYLRVRWLTHHRSEYYCTLTGIKVHGHNAIQSLEKEMNRRHATEGEDDDEATTAIIAAIEDEDGVASEVEVVRVAPPEQQELVSSSDAPEASVVPSPAALTLETSAHPSTDAATASKSDPVNAVVDGSTADEPETAQEELIQAPAEAERTASEATADQQAPAAEQEPSKTPLDADPAKVDESVTPSTQGSDVVGDSVEHEHGSAKNLPAAPQGADTPGELTIVNRTNTTAEPSAAGNSTISQPSQRATPPAPADVEPSASGAHGPGNASAVEQPVISPASSSQPDEHSASSPAGDLPVNSTAEKALPANAPLAPELQQEEQQQEEQQQGEQQQGEQQQGEQQQHPQEEQLNREAFPELAEASIVPSPESPEASINTRDLAQSDKGHSTLPLGSGQSHMPQPPPLDRVPLPVGETAPSEPEDSAEEAAAISQAQTTAKDEDVEAAKCATSPAEPTCALRVPWRQPPTERQPTSTPQAPSPTDGIFKKAPTATVTPADPVAKPSLSFAPSPLPTAASPSSAPAAVSGPATVTAMPSLVVVQVTDAAAVVVASPQPGLPVVTTSVPGAADLPGISVVPDTFNLTKRPQKQVQVGQNTWQVLLDHIEDTSKARGRDAKRLFSFVRALQLQTNAVMHRLGAATLSAVQASNLSAIAQAQLQQRIDEVASAVNVSLQQISAAGVSMAWTSSLCEPETMELVHRWAPPAFATALMLVITVLWQCCMTCALRAQVRSLSRKVERLQQPQEAKPPSAEMQTRLAASARADS